MHPRCVAHLPCCDTKPLINSIKIFIAGYYKFQHRQMCWWKFYFILNILQYWMIKRKKIWGLISASSSVCTAYRQKTKQKDKKTATAVFRFELVHVGFLRFLQQSADVSGRMGPHGWDWGGTRIHSKSLETDGSSSVETFCPSLPVRICQSSRVCGRICLTEITAACVVPSLAERVLRNVVQCKVHDTRTKCLVVAQYCDVKNVTQEIMLSAASGSPGRSLGH